MVIKYCEQKIDMSSSNLNLRDPILYRIHEKHHRTGNKWQYLICMTGLMELKIPLRELLIQFAP